MALPPRTVRLDPFQQIVGVGWGNRAIGVLSFDAAKRADNEPVPFWEASVNAPDPIGVGGGLSAPIGVLISPPRVPPPVPPATQSAARAYAWSYEPVSDSSSSTEHTTTSVIDVETRGVLLIWFDNTSVLVTSYTTSLGHQIFPMTIEVATGIGTDASGTPVTDGGLLSAELVRIQSGAGPKGFPVMAIPYRLSVVSSHEESVDSVTNRSSVQSVLFFNLSRAKTELAKDHAHTYSFTVDIPTCPPRTVINYSVSFSTYKGENNFPVDQFGVPNFSVPIDSDGFGDGNGSLDGAPLPPHTITFTIDLDTLEVTASPSSF